MEFAYRIVLKKVRMMKNSFSKLVQKTANVISAKLEKSLFADKGMNCSIVYGPFISRRLGVVLGVNNTSSKICSYNCIYCTAGETNLCTTGSNCNLLPEELYIAVRRKIETLKGNKDRINYLLFTGNSEPLLDPFLQKEIKILRELGYKIGVFTNSSMLWNNAIRENLRCADLVSVKVDTVIDETWYKINRPHNRLEYGRILDGIVAFAKEYKGTLLTDTMLINNLNDSDCELEELSCFLNKLEHRNSYFMSPIYPTIEEYAIPPEDEKTEYLRRKIRELIPNSVMLCSPQNSDFQSTLDFENELMGLLKIHPVSEDAVNRFAEKAGSIDLLKYFIKTGQIKGVVFNGKRYYMPVEGTEYRV